MTYRLYNKSQKTTKQSNTVSFIFLATTTKISIKKPFINKVVSRIQPPSPHNEQ